MRWLLRIATGLAVLVIAVVAVISLIPSERVAALAASEFQRLFGRELQITGEVKTRLWPVLGVETGPVTIANADWSDADAPMFTAEKLVIGVNAASLLGVPCRSRPSRLPAPHWFWNRRATGGRTGCSAGAAAAER